jgi:diguanylate cyclase (GGDEF)-like protein
LNLRLSKGQILLIVVSLAALCAYAVLIAIFPDSFTGLFYGFLTAFTLLAFGACLWRAWHCPPGMKTQWLLLSAGMLSWAVAHVMSATAEYLYHSSFTTATVEDFFYFFYGIPLLLAISMPEKGETSLVLSLLDVIQAVAAGYLAYVALFRVLPFTGIPIRPISAFSVLIIYDAENLILAILATVRLAVGARGSVERRFFQILSGYLWVYIVCITFFNHVLVNGPIGTSHPTLTNILAALACVPTLTLALAAVLLATPARRTLEPEEKTALALLIYNSRPIFLGLALVTLCAVIARQHLLLALGFIFGAFVLYGIRSALLQSRIQQTRSALEKANGLLEELAMQDGLTGIANRRCFNQRFEAEWSRAHRLERPLSLLLIDLDHLKQLNDGHGHVAGDECLQSLSAALRGVLRRPGDLLARYGGDEFVALLPETDAAGAVRVAVLMKDAFAAHAWNSDGDNPPMTVSIGCSSWDSRHADTAEELMEAADKALYQAKQQGRDRVEFMEMRPAAVQ